MQLGRLLIFVVTTNKIHSRLFVPAFRRAIKNHQRADQLLATTGIARIRMKDVASVILRERAKARQFRLRRSRMHRRLWEVVENLAGREIVFAERNVVVIVEVGPEGRHPGESPPHAYLIRLDFGQRRTTLRVVANPVAVRSVRPLFERRKAAARG